MAQPPEPVLRGALCRGTAAGAKCENCPLAKNKQPNKPVVAEGPIDPDWIIVGEGPGQTETALGRPFCGASGGLVDKALTAIHCDRRRVWVSNATLCLPPADAGESVRVLAQRCCEPRFLTELAKLPGKPVLALGAVAMRAMLGSGFSIMEISGSYHEVDPDGTGLRSVIPTLHPAAILRGGSGVGGAHSPDLAFWNFLYDAAKIHALAQGRDIVFHEEDIYTEWEDPKRAEELVRAIAQEARQQRMVAVDTETYVDDEKRYSALQPRNAKMSAIGLATARWGISVAWSIVTPRAKRLIGALMADPGVRTAMHNRIYDRPVLRRHGLPVFGPCDDTLLKHHNAFPGLAHDLQRVATQYFAITPWKSEFRHGKDTLENLTRYNAKDTLVTARLDEPLTTALAHTKTEPGYEVDLMCAEVAEWMYDAGIPVSREVNRQLYDQFWANMEASRAVIEEKANEPEIRQVLWERLAAEQAKRYRKGSQVKPDPENYKERIQVRLDEIKKAHADGKWEWKINSAADLGALLKIHGIELEETPTGRPKITLGVLKKCAEDNPIAAAIYAYRKDKTDEAAKKAVEDEAARLEIREQLWQAIAAEQAKTIRKAKGTPADPLDYDERRGVRLREIEEAYEKGQWQWRIGSSDHIAAYLRARGVPLYILTEKGSTSTKKEILEGFAHLPEVSSLIDYRENQKMFSTFCYRLFDRYDEEGNIVSYGHADENDRIHPRWSVHRITGRWSAEDPQTQNWPKADPKKGRPNLRSQVIAPDGRMLVGFDAAQLEARIIALLSGDAFLFDIFDNDKDIHSEMARVVWPDYDEIPYERRKVLRDTIKRPEYGAFYGGSIDTLWNNIRKDYPDVQLQDIARMVALMTAKMPGVTRWHQRLLQEVAKPPHEIRSAIYGRRRCFPLGNADINEVYNYPVQCLEASQRVLTTDGWKSIEVLTTRDVLVQPSGRETTNFKVWCSDVQKVYMLQTKSRKVICTAGHRFLRIIDGVVEWVRLDDLRPNDGIVIWDSPEQAMAAYFPCEPILRITPQHLAATFDIEIFDGDHGYVAEGLVTHNSTGADIMAYGLRRLLPRLRQNYRNADPIIQIHDAMVFECDEQDADRLKEDVRECFEQSHTHNGVTIHFPVDPTSGKSWAEV